MAFGLERIYVPGANSKPATTPVKSDQTDNLPIGQWDLVGIDRLTDPAMTPAPSDGARRTIGQVASDTGLQFMKGVMTTAGAAPNLVAPEGDTAKLFNDAARFYDDQQSDTMKALTAAASAKIDVARKTGEWDAFTTALAEYSTTPALFSKFVIENAASLIPGLGAAKGAQVLTKGAALARGATAARAAQVGATAGTVAGGATNAAMNAGGARQDSFEDWKQTLMANGMGEAEATAMAVEKSRLAAGIGGITGALSGATGLERGIVGAVTKGGLKGFATGAASEFGGEMLEELTPKAATNVQIQSADPSRPWNRGLGETAAQTIVASSPGAVLSGVSHARGSQDSAAGDNAIPGADLGIDPTNAGPTGPADGGPGGMEGEYIPGASRPIDSRLGYTGETYDQAPPAYPANVPALPAPAPMEGDVLGPDQLPAGQGLLPQGSIDSTATSVPESVSLPPPSARQVATARGLLNYSPNASPETLIRLMRVDPGTARMLFEHWAATEGPQQPQPQSPTPTAPQGAVSTSALPDGTENPITAVDVLAHGAATSPHNSRSEPTDAQKQAGNYAKGHVRFSGLDISIENPQGSMRSGTDTAGKRWETTMQHHYGYIKGTIGKDKDHLDVFIKPGTEQSDTVFVVDQVDPKTGRFDEHKIVLGAQSVNEAQDIYHQNYQSGWKGMGAITPMPMADFKQWIKNGDTTKPMALNPQLAKLQAQYAAATEAGNSFEVQRLAHEINQARKQDSTPKIPTKAEPPKEPGAYGKVGRTPLHAAPVSLKDNGDGTATVMRGDEPFVDYDSGDDVTVPSGASPVQVRDAIKKSGALSNVETHYGVKDTQDQVRDATKMIEPAQTGTKPAEQVTEPTKPETIVGKPVTSMTDDQLARIATAGNSYSDSAKEKAKAELDRRKAGEGTSERTDYLAGMYQLDQKLKNRQITPGDYNKQSNALRSTYGKQLASLMVEGKALPVLVETPPKRLPLTPSYLYRMNGDHFAIVGNGKNELSTTVPVDQIIYDRNREPIDLPGRDETGKFGPILRDYYHDAQGAIAKLKELQTGEAVAALSHKDVGDIDLVWGHTSDDPRATGEGLAKLVRWHPEVLDDLQGFIDSLRVHQRHDKLIHLTDGGKKRAGVRLDYNGKTKTWLLTAYERGANKNASEKEAGGDASSGISASAGLGGGTILATPPSTSGETIAQPQAEAKDAPAATHIENGVTKPATPAAIGQSIAKSAANTPMNLKEAKDWLLKKIDAAILDSEYATDAEWADAMGISTEQRKSPTMYAKFDVPGDGKFSVKNNKERLREFRKEIQASKGFGTGKGSPMSTSPGISRYTVRDMLEDGELMAAVEYGKLTGKPLLFGETGAKDQNVPVAYTDAEDADLKGFNLRVGRLWNRASKSSEWAVIEMDTGGRAAVGATKAKAIQKLTENIAQFGPDHLRAQIKKYETVTQEALEKRWTDWASEQEKKDEAQREADAKAEDNRQQVILEAQKKQRTLETERRRAEEYRYLMSATARQAQDKIAAMSEDDAKDALERLNKAPGDNKPIRALLEQKVNPAIVGKPVAKMTDDELARIVSPANKSYSAEAKAKAKGELTKRKKAPTKPAEKPVSNTEDSGEELTQNLRNKRTRGLKWQDIANQEAALRVKEVTKAKVYLKPDYAALAEQTSPLKAHLVKQVYDAIAPDPKTKSAPTDQELQDYIAEVNRVMSAVLDWMGDAAIVAQYRIQSGGKSLLDAVYPDGWRAKNALIQLLGSNRFLGALQPGYDEIKRAEKDIAKGWPAPQESWQRQGYKVVAKDESVHVRPTNVDSKYYLSVDGGFGKTFTTKAEAESAVLSMKPWLALSKGGSIIGMYDSKEAALEFVRKETSSEGRSGKVSDKGIAVDQARREGPARRMEGESITSDQLLETFGFKGVNFGNWMKGGGTNANERQLHLNHAYDSFMDLAEIIGVPPRAMSLNGMLGIAFGAQGRAGAAAHFVPGVNEINLTRESGAGSLGHEFAHALDHYFARMAGLDRESEPFLTEHTGRNATGELRREVMEKFKAIVTAMNERPATAEEIASRQKSMVEKWSKQVDAWLRSIRRRFESTTLNKSANEDGASLRSKVLTRFDEISQRIRELNLGDGMIAIGRFKSIFPAVAEIRDLHNDVFGRQLGSVDLTGLSDAVDMLKFATGKQASDQNHASPMVSTDFARNAAALDKEDNKRKPYWNTNLEKFARAFDAFLSDTLESKTSLNSYLSHSGRTGKTVPEGAERASINAAFKELMDTIQSKETDKGVAIFSEGSGVVPEGRRLSAGKLADIVAKVFSQLGHQPPIIISDSLAEVTGVADDAGRAAGMVSGGRIYLFRDAITDDAHAFRTLWHELLHYGIRRFLSEDQYIEQMNGLAMRDDVVRQQAQAWIDNSPAASEARKYAESSETLKGRVDDYLMARGVDEALAGFSESIGAANSPYRKNGALASTLRTIRGWLADLADSIGMRRIGKWIREMDNKEAREYVQRILDGLRTNATASNSDWGFTADNSFSETKASKWDAPEPSFADRLIYRMQDKLVDLKRIQQEIKAALGDISEAFDAYLQEELFHGRSAKATEEFLKRELEPFLGEMKQRGIDMESLETFLWARHAAERNAQIAKINPDMPDGGSGLTDKQAADLLAGKDVAIDGRVLKGIPPTKLRSFTDLARKIDVMVAGNRILLERYELETADTLAAWAGAYKHYVPLHREDADTPWAGNGTGQGYSVKGASSKRATGSFRPVENILANLVLQRTRIITRGEKNRVAQALYGLAKSNPHEDFWKVDDAPKIRVPKEMAIYSVMSNGKKIGEFTRLAEAEKAARGIADSDIYQTWGERVVEQVDPNFKNKPNVMFARFNGKDRFVVFNERDERALRLAESIKNLDVEDMAEWMGEMSRWTRYFAAINTQYNPVFGVVNLVRDSLGGMINLSSTPIAGHKLELLGNLYHALPAIFKSVRIDRKGGTPTGTWADLWEDLQERGGMTGYRDMFRNSHEQKEALERALDPMWWQDKWWGKGLTLGGVLAVPEQFLADKAGKPLFNLLSDYNTMMEGAIRLSAYKIAVDQGLSRDKAASVAKNITVNFNRKGQIGRQANALYAFFNASVQGTARLAETMHHGAKPGELLGKAGKQIVYGGFLLGSLQAMMLMATGFGEDEPPDFVRDKNLIIPLLNGKYVTIPLPLGFHVFPAFGRITTEFVLGGFKKPGKRVMHIGQLLIDAFNPIGSTGSLLQTALPTVADPIAALYENKDWTGKKIYKEDFSSLNPTPGFTRSKDTATFFSKGLAYYLNLISGGTEFKPGVFSPTPDQIDYLIGQVTGGVGREISKGIQTAQAMKSGEDLPPHKVPLLGRFYGDAKSQSSARSSFYENVKELNAHQLEIQGLAKSGRQKEASAYMKENPGSEMFREADLIERYVTNLNKTKRELLAKDAPRSEVKAIEDKTAKLMSDFNARLEKAQNPPPTKSSKPGLERIVPAY